MIVKEYDKYNSFCLIKYDKLFNLSNKETVLFRQSKKRTSCLGLFNRPIPILPGTKYFSESLGSTVFRVIDNIP